MMVTRSWGGRRRRYGLNKRSSRDLKMRAKAGKALKSDGTFPNLVITCWFVAPAPSRVVYFLVDPLTARALINTPKVDEDIDNPASTTAFSYVVANDCVAHFTIFLLDFLRISDLRHSRSQRLYGLTLFCLCSDPIHVDLAGLHTAKWHHKSVIIPFRGRGLHRQLQATPMADPSQL